MFLQLNHQKLEVFVQAKAFSIQSYKVTKALPANEMGNLVQQIRRAAVSVVLNIAEGYAKRSPLDRVRFFEIARASLVEVDAALDLCKELGYIGEATFPELNQSMNSCFALLSKLIINSTPSG